MSKKQKLELYRSLLEKKKRRGLKDLFFFNKYIIEQNKERRKNIVPHVHGEWVDWFNNSDTRIKMILVPRSSFKTTFWTVGWVLQKIVQNPDIRILLANATLPNAQQFLGEIKDHIRRNKTFKLLYGNLYDKNLKWSESEIVVPRSPGIRESTVTAMGAGGNLVSRHFDLIVGDDLVNRENSATRYQADKIIDWWKRSLSLLEVSGEFLLIGCLTKDSKVLMGNGTWKDIVDVEVGEKVWSYNVEKRKRIKKEVEAIIPQGKAKVFEVKTAHHSLKATANHPFLTIEGGKNDWKLVWKKVEELKKGDYVLTIKQVFSNYRQRLKEWNGRQMDKDFLWLLGFMFGDGWICRVRKTEKRSESWAVCVSKSVQEWKNKKVCVLLEKYFGRKPYLTLGRYYRLDCNEAGRMFERIGLSNKDTAKTKRVPKWIYKSQPCLKRSFLKGLACADGHEAEAGHEWRIELSNKGLVEDIKYLSLTCGVRPTSIYYRERMIQAPNSPKPIKSKTWSIGLIFYCCNKVENKTIFRGMQWDLKGIRIDKVIEIKSKGEREVFDLTVKDTHNFIAEGFVVHNTRWSYYELYSHIIDNLPEEVDRYIRGVYNEDGSLYFPERFDEKKLDELKKLHGSYIYSSFYLNNPVDEDSALIKESQIKYYGENEEVQQPKDLAVFSACDPAISQSTYADYSTIITVGVDNRDNWFVLEVLREKWAVSELIENLFSVNERFEPESMTLEVIGMAQTLLTLVYREEEERGTYLPLVEIKSRPPIEKERKIRSILQPRFERGKVYIRKDMEDLKEELLKFPKSKHDDIIDALSDIDEIGFKCDTISTEKVEKTNLQRRLEATLKNKKKPYCDPYLGEYV